MLPCAAFDGGCVQGHEQLLPAPNELRPGPAAQPAVAHASGLYRLYGTWTPGTHVDSEGEARSRLLAWAALPWPYGFGGSCLRSGISLADVSSWSYHNGAFSKQLSLNSTVTCTDSHGSTQGPASEGATLGVPLGCVVISDEIRSLAGGSLQYAVRSDRVRASAVDRSAAMLR